MMEIWQNTEHARFFRNWLSYPLRVGAIAPSGQSLAALMTSEKSAATGPVLELGPGTGVFTKALLERGVTPLNLTLIESGKDFATLLEARFPGVRVLHMDAARLSRTILFEDACLGAVISGLPLLSMPPRKLMMILAGATGWLRPGGAFFQFTYGPRCPVPRPILVRLGLKAKCIGRTFHNMPPATVYRISRRRLLKSAIEGIAT
ncbi:methyltransferase domain-containing protein [Cohaesibacter sp. CAU 1516]|uniref:class I SAM-dependent methyltransferase n=1 Tax=Cohaesibacter sp. CAU 1516 TaxID=2576038 RepID=UPI0010FE512D|nr:methyltransferase domain-containing protein [Cohaesibacter sp. CAU 1516]TLP42596.1 methyltransferase domain-containing protein [Cohaesibacter sp. CAU 1516]